MHFCRRPHPARAFGAPPPPPPGGGVRAWRYQVSSRARGGAGGKPYLGWSRGKAVSGVELVGNRIRGGADGQPYPALLQDLPMLWTVWISPRGERLTGRGNLFPIPCLPHFNHLTSHRRPPPRPRLRRSSPAPSRRAGSVRGDIRGTTVPGVEPGNNRIRGGAGEQPYPGWNRWEAVSGVESVGSRIRGGYRHGGRRLAGRGLPPLLPLTLQTSYFSGTSPGRG